MTETRHGYLILADISGYTGFLAQVELEHADEILTDLLEAIVEQFKTILTISKLEGDAVFATVDEQFVTRPESLLELIENTYLAFRRRRDSSQRATTCTCRACRSMPSLELKFFVHHGEYIVQNISGIRELLGSDVNLIHRLLKNHITESTGWQAYALFSEAAAQCIAIGLDEMHAQDEDYEHIGTVRTHTLNLIPRYEALIAAQRVLIEPKDADMILSHEFDAPSTRVWDWIMDIQHRTESMAGGGVWTAVARPQGNRSGAGSINHCAHGKGISRETVLDWRPFNYVSSETVHGALTFRETYFFVPLQESRRTRLELRLKIVKPWPQSLVGLMARYVFKLDDSYRMWFASLDNLLAAQARDLARAESS